jgi:multidrug efflux pump subunit AcrB
VLLLCGSLATAAAFPFIGMAYFPRTDPGQFVVNVKAPTGTRVEVTEDYVEHIEGIIRRIVSPSDLDVIASNIGITPGFSAIYTSNTGSHTAFIQVSLKQDHSTGSYEYMNRVRAAVSAQYPQLSTYFQSGGLVDAVLNQGLPAPVDIQVQGSDLNKTHEIAVGLQQQLAKLPEVSDVYIPQDVDAPSLRIQVDRQHADELGLSQQEVADNLITSLTSNQMIAPSYYIDPRNGNQYFLTVQYPENDVQNVEDLETIALRSPKSDGHLVLMNSVANITPTTAPTVITHNQLDRVIDVYVASKGENLRRLQSDVNGILARTQLPEGITIATRGSVEAMNSSLSSFASGLILAIVLVYLVLVAQFRSFVDPVIILFAIPPGLAGAILTLLLTHTTLNVMSLMGIVMMVGIVVSNSILIVDLAHRIGEEQHESAERAVAVACRLRLRPILMTSLATIIGLVPMSIGLAAGSESYAPLARVVIGGLSLSVLVTVFIVPAAFVLVHRDRFKRHASHAAAAGA